MKMKTEEWMVDEWNKNHVVGTEVILTNDSDEEIETVTRSEAWIVCGSAVVMVKGISGGYSLDRIRQKK